MEDGAYDDVASQSTDVDDRIRVCLRVRPPIAGDSIVTVDDDVTVRLEGARKSLAAQFDGVFDGDASQRDVYERGAGPAVRASLEGLHSTVLAYGQTGSGKTHTVFGGLLPSDPKPPPAGSADAEAAVEARAGVVSRALRELFEVAARREAAGERLSIALSFFEIYNESLSDLFAAPASHTHAPPPVSVHEDENGEVFVRGVVEQPVPTIAAAMRAVRRALRQRSVRPTDANERSSRSHAVLR